MNDYRINWAMPMPKLGNKVEQYTPTADDKRAMELCKFEQKRHEVEPEPLYEIPSISLNRDDYVEALRILWASWGAR